MLFQLVPLFGYLVGTALHTLIATLVMGRKEKRPSERIFLVLVIALGIWHSGNLIAWVLQGLSHGEWRQVSHLARTIAFLGLAALPPLLVHTHVAFLSDSGSSFMPRKFQSVLMTIFYLPLLWFIKPLYAMFIASTGPSAQSLAPYVLVYVSWFVLSLLISAAIDMRLARIQEDEPFRHFYRVLGTTLLFIAILTTFTYILRGREFPQLRGYLEVLGITASIVPSTVLAYFIYRYNFLELVIRRSFFVITLSVVIFGMYYRALLFHPKLLES